MSLLSVCCMGKRGIVFKFADFAACPADLCFFLIRDQPDSSRYSVFLILGNEENRNDINANSG